LVTVGMALAARLPGEVKAALPAPTPPATEPRDGEKTVIDMKTEISKRAP